MIVEIMHIKESYIYDGIFLNLCTKSRKKATYDIDYYLFINRSVLR